MIEYKIISVGDMLCDPGSTKPVPGRTGNPTITLIQADRDILVDPGQGYPFNQVPAAIELFPKILPHLDSRDLYVFVTHPHHDHCNMVSALGFVATSDKYKCRYTLIEQKEGEIATGVRILPTPGHLPDHRSLEFRADEGRVIVAGDAVLNEAYFRETSKWKRIYAPNEPTEEDVDLAVKSMEMIRERADIIVPGHGPAFLVRK